MALGAHAVAMAESAHRVQAGLQATEQLSNIARDEFCRVLNGGESLESSSGLRGIRRWSAVGRRIDSLFGWLHAGGFSPARLAGLRTRAAVESCVAVVGQKSRERKTRGLWNCGSIFSNSTLFRPACTLCERSG